MEQTFRYLLRIWLPSGETFETRIEDTPKNVWEAAYALSEGRSHQIAPIRTPK